MNKRDLIKYISANSGENDSWGNLVTKKRSELEQIYDYLQKVNEFEGETPEPVEDTFIVPQPGEEEFEEKEEEILEEPKGLSDEVKEKIDKIVEEVVQKFKPKAKVKNDGQEYVEHKKPSELSASERKAYARTGKLPKKKR